MNLPASAIAALASFQWPSMPALPQCCQPVLMRVSTASRRELARQELREVLRALLAAWSGLTPTELPLGETAHGPVWRGRLAGKSLDISLSYTAGEGWIGLIRGALIGVDVMRVEPIAEALAVARLYLGPEAEAELRQSSNPAVAFATAWTRHEASLKCLKRGLVEWRAELAEPECLIQTVIVSDRILGAVAIASASGT